MATHTTYYNLTKPAQNDKVNIGVLNDNADIIDTALHNKVDSDDLTANNVMLSDGVTSVEDALDAVANNSWVTLNANVKYRVTGGLVYISVNITNTAGNWSDIGLMPSGIRPRVNTYNCAYYRTGDGKYANLYVAANGTIQAQSNADVPNGYIIYPKE